MGSLLAFLVALVILAVFLPPMIFPSKATEVAEGPGFAYAIRQIATACWTYCFIHGEYPYSEVSSDDALVRILGDDEEASTPLYFRWLRRKSGDGADYWYLNKPGIAKLPEDTILLVEKVPSRVNGVYVCTKDRSTRLLNPLPGGEPKGSLGEKTVRA